MRKGTKIVIEGELQNNDYTNKNGEKVYSIQIVTSQIEFAESKASQNHPQEPPVGNVPDEGGFMSIPDDIEDELPFN